jgi:DNA-binding transcriptional MerR regulator
MNKNLPQISLDFGPEPEPSPNPPAGEKGQAADPLTTQYMAAGVGVRIKSLKTQKSVSSEPQPVTGNLFGNAGETALPHVEPAPVTETTVLTTEQTAPVPAEPAPLAQTTLIESPIPRIPRRKDRVTAPAGPAETPKTVKSKRGRKSLKQVSAEADLIEIPADEVLFSKQYYTMGEVSEMFRVNQSLLRFWETEFDILQPRKNKKGDRYFRPVDIKNLHLIYHLLRQRKYTIEGAKEFLKKNKKGEERFETIQRLQEIKAFLQEWKAHINF